MENLTPKRRLADLLLPEGLEHFVRSRRANGVAWRVVARDLWMETEGELDITFESLRAWFPDEAEAAS